MLHDENFYCSKPISNRTTYWAVSTFDWINLNGHGFVNKFDLQLDGKVIVDSACGLMWQQSGSDDILNFTERKLYIDSLNSKKFSGFDNWRLPTLEEAMSLVEPYRENGNLHINELFDKKQIAIWTADDVWGVYFYFGFCHAPIYVYVVVINEPKLYYARAVRSLSK